jgi:hypothetical protein
MAITPIPAGLMGVASAMVRPEDGSAPYVALGAFKTATSTDHIAALMPPAILDYASDHAFAADLFEPFRFAHVPLEGDASLRRVAEERLADLLAADALGLPPVGHGIKEALMGHSRTKRLTSPALRLVLVVASGYQLPRSDTTRAGQAPDVGIVGSGFSVETNTLGSISGESPFGGGDDVTFTQRMIAGLRPNTFGNPFGRR